MISLADRIGAFHNFVPVYLINSSAKFFMPKIWDSEHFKICFDVKLIHNETSRFSAVTFFNIRLPKRARMKYWKYFQWFHICLIRSDAVINDMELNQIFENRYVFQNSCVFGFISLKGVMSCRIVISKYQVWFLITYGLLCFLLP